MIKNTLYTYKYHGHLNEAVKDDNEVYFILLCLRQMYHGHPYIGQLKTIIKYTLVKSLYSYI